MTILPAPDGRHLTMENVATIWQSKLDMQLPIEGEPRCTLLVRPRDGLISLVTPYEPPEPDVARLRNITLLTFAEDGAEWSEIRVKVSPGGVHAAYGLLTSIADQVQLRHRPLAAAVTTAVEAHRGMVAQRGALTREKEIGLFGELRFFRFLVSAMGAKEALDSWAGPLSEEHDFVFSAVHLEAKTTSAERRRHIIGSLDQLVPLRGVPLHVLSTQLTVSTGDLGQTLPQLVASARQGVGGHQEALDERLEASGWDDEHAPLYRTVWTERTTPRAFLVDDDFPAVKHGALAGVVPHFELVSDVRYTVDLTDFPFTPLPSPLDGYIESPKGKL